MFLNIFIIFISGIILLLPLLFWMYVVIGFSQYAITRKEFITGLASGVLIATLFSPYSFPFVGGILESVFYGLTIMVQGSGIQLFTALGFLFFFLLLLVILSQYIFIKNMKHAFWQSIVSFLGYLLVIGCSVIIIKGLLSLSPESTGEIQVGFREYVFSFFGAIVGYYIVIGVIEEGAKYLGSISTSPRLYKLHKNQFILFGICAALGFSFLENILYTVTFILTNTIDTQLIQLVFFRSIFALCLHIFCSLLMSFGFYYLYSNAGFSRIKILGMFGCFTLLSVFSHMLFDVGLTYGYMGVIFLYVIALYLSMSLILDSQEDRLLENIES